VACGAKLQQILSNGGGNWPLLEHCQPAAQTQGRRDVSQDNTTKHKFWNANLHVIMQNPVDYFHKSNLREPNNSGPSPLWEISTFVHTRVADRHLVSWA